MKNKLGRLLLLCVPCGLAGCGLLDRRKSQHNDPEVICGSQVDANYTVPQWGVLPATPAACCLPVCVEHSQFSMIESTPQPAMDTGIGEQVRLDGQLSESNAQSFGLLESPVVIPNPNRPRSELTPEITRKVDDAEVTTAPSPSDVSEPQTLVPSTELPPAETDAIVDPLLQSIGFPALPDTPAIQIPEVDEPQATGWGEADLPTVPQMAGDLFQYVL